MHSLSYVTFMYFMRRRHEVILNIHSYLTTEIRRLRSSPSNLANFIVAREIVSLIRRQERTGIQSDCCGAAKGGGEWREGEHATFISPLTINSPAQTITLCYISSTLLFLFRQVLAPLLQWDAGNRLPAASLWCLPPTYTFIICRCYTGTPNNMANPRWYTEKDVRILEKGYKYQQNRPDNNNSKAIITPIITVLFNVGYELGVIKLRIINTMLWQQPRHSKWDLYSSYILITAGYSSSINCLIP
jgi:hypothetical protein